MPFYPFSPLMIWCCMLSITSGRHQNCIISPITLAFSCPSVLMDSELSAHGCVSRMTSSSWFLSSTSYWGIPVVYSSHRRDFRLGENAETANISTCKTFTVYSTSQSLTRWTDVLSIRSLLLFIDFITPRFFHTSVVDEGSGSGAHNSRVSHLFRASLPSSLLS